MEELVARLRAIVRRATGHAAPIITAGEVTLDPRQMRVSVRGVPVALSPQDSRLVAYLMHPRGRVVTQLELTEHLYQDRKSVVWGKSVSVRVNFGGRLIIK